MKKVFGIECPDNKMVIRLFSGTKEVYYDDDLGTLLSKARSERDTALCAIEVFNRNDERVFYKRFPYSGRLS